MNEHYVSPIRKDDDVLVRYRRDIYPERKICVYVKEIWERYECAPGSLYRTGLRLVESLSQEKWEFPLTGWELQAAQAGWQEPAEYTYHKELPTQEPARI